MIKIECQKCSGTGMIKAFSHVHGGTCFSCGGIGHRMQKTASKKSKSFTFSFLWEDPSDENYNNGKFCKCFTRKARSFAAAERLAADAMKKNGSAKFLVEEA